MAARSHRNHEHLLVITRTVVAAGAATKGRMAKFGATEQQVTNAGANEKGFGIFLESAVAGADVQIALLQGAGIIEVLVGTGGATEGEFAVGAADGLTNQTLGGGNTVKYIAGTFLQTGVAGDYVGLLPGKFAAGAA